jgi:hypothetical protein
MWMNVPVLILLAESAEVTFMHMQNWPIIYFMPESRLGIDVLWAPVCIQTRPSTYIIF